MNNQFNKEYLQQYLNDKLNLWNLDSNSNLEPSSWNDFNNKYKSLTDFNTNYFQSILNLPNDIILSFHDGFFHNIKPNLSNDTFNISILTYKFQKINDVQRNETYYEEIDSLYLNFTINNSFRNQIRKLTQMHDILDFIYDGENLGLLILNKQYKHNIILIPNIDLSNANISEHNKSKKSKLKF